MGRVDIFFMSFPMGFPVRFHVPFYLGMAYFNHLSLARKERRTPKNFKAEQSPISST
jgi:hypothetical protein